MRKLILTVLLATSVAMPAMAQDRDRGQRERGERNASSAQRDEARVARRAERAERPQRIERERPQAVEREARSEVREQAVVQRRDRREERRGDWGQRRSNDDGLTAAIERQQAARAAAQRQSLAQQRDYRRDGRNDGSVIDRAIERARTSDRQVVVNRDRDPRWGSRYSRDHRRWSNDWRGDRNYDWRNYRHRNRSVFRFGNYYDPYGSSYRRFSIGFSLFPSYYQSNYWLNDPWTYRLPPAYGPYRWVRYYDDALLVNVYTGQVVDVEHNVFW